VSKGNIRTDKKCSKSTQEHNKLVRDKKKSKTGIPPQSVALCPGNSRCGRGDEERTSRQSMDREKQDMNIGICRRPGIVSKE